VSRVVVGVVVVVVVVVTVDVVVVGAVGDDPPPPPHPTAHETHRIKAARRIGIGKTIRDGGDG